jgi:hypothetical protein
LGVTRELDAPVEGPFVDVGRTDISATLESQPELSWPGCLGLAICLCQESNPHATQRTLPGLEVQGGLGWRASPPASFAEISVDSFVSPQAPQSA